MAGSVHAAEKIVDSHFRRKLSDKSFHWQSRSHAESWRMIAREIVLHAFGTPESAATLEANAVAPPGVGEVQLGIRYAPINPADLNVLEGTYGTLPNLPARVGNEAVGVVSAVGAEVLGFEIGDVVLPLGRGLWAEFINLPATRCHRLPAAVDLPQAAMLRVNPATAWLLLTSYRTLPAGAWIVQNAGNSGVGMAITQLATTAGWRVLSLVRRAEAAAQCRTLGAQHVVCEADADWKEQALAILGDQRAQLGLNAVGGESALRVASLLADEAVHVTYGAMSRQKVSLPNRFLIFQNLTFTGFWLSRWMQRASAQDRTALYDFLAAELVAGRCQLPIANVYPVEDITAALTHAQTSQRAGKILLSWT